MARHGEFKGRSSMPTTMDALREIIETSYLERLRGEPVDYPREHQHTPMEPQSTQMQPLQGDIEFGVGPHGASTGKGILIGMLSAFGSALFVALIFLAIYFLRYTTRGRIILDRIGRPGEYDDEQAFAREEAEALEQMDDIQRAEYMRAKAFVQSNPPESVHTDISLSQFLAIQEKGVSAWEFEPELEIANCFVEGRTEIEFFDSECSVQSNLPIPKQNEVYYWEAKIYDMPETTTVGIGVTTKPYPTFKMPGYHKTSVAYLSPGHRRFNQPFSPTPNYGPPYVRGDVIGVGYRPRSGTIFFTRNGKKLDEVTHSLKTQNLFPTVGATGPCTIHVNFGQLGFVFIEANVKKWGLAPTTGSLAPPPPYGSEQGSILLEGGQHGVQEGQGWLNANGSWPGSGGGHARSRSAQIRLARQQPTSPGPQRSPTDISLSALSYADSIDQAAVPGDEDAGEGTSTSVPTQQSTLDDGSYTESVANTGLGIVDVEVPPPEYESPGSETDLLLSEPHEGERPTTQARPELRRSRNDSELSNSDRRRALGQSRARRQGSPPIPSYDAAVGGSSGSRAATSERQGHARSHSAR